LWVGLCVSFLYVGILQSKIGKGQSIAKRLFKIEVIRLDGGYLSLVKSFMRYIIIALIFYNSWIWLALTSILPILNNDAIRMVFFLMVACLFIGTVFLLLSIRKNVDCMTTLRVVL